MNIRRLSELPYLFGQLALNFVQICLWCYLRGLVLTSAEHQTLLARTLDVIGLGLAARIIYLGIAATQAEQKAREAKNVFDDGAPLGHYPLLIISLFAEFGTIYLTQGR